MQGLVDDLGVDASGRAEDFRHGGLGLGKPSYRTLKVLQSDRQIITPVCGRYHCELKHMGKPSGVIVFESGMGGFGKFSLPSPIIDGVPKIISKLKLTLKSKEAPKVMAQLLGWAKFAEEDVVLE